MTYHIHSFNNYLIYPSQYGQNFTLLAFALALDHLHIVSSKYFPILSIHNWFLPLDWLHHLLPEPSTPPSLHQDCTHLA